jgi:hypothetical protein
MGADGVKPLRPPAHPHLPPPGGKNLQDAAVPTPVSPQEGEIEKDAPHAFSTLNLARTSSHQAPLTEGEGATTGLEFMDSALLWGNNTGERWWLTRRVKPVKEPDSG